MPLAKRIIPCLDVDAGRVVKGVQFVDIRDAGDPVEVAKRYDREGADEITFLDITASSDQRETMAHVVEQVASEVFIPLTVGGGESITNDFSRGALGSRFSTPNSLHRLRQCSSRSLISKRFGRSPNSIDFKITNSYLVLSTNLTT